MEKDLERSFLEILARTLVSLPFDLKILLEAVSDPNLDHSAREVAVAAVVYIIAPREGTSSRTSDTARTCWSFVSPCARS